MKSDGGTLSPDIVSVLIREVFVDAQACLFGRDDERPSG